MNESAKINFNKFTILIEQLVPTDDYAIIDNSQNYDLTDFTRAQDNFGKYFDITNLNIVHSILDLAAQSQVVLTLNSNLDVALQRGDAISQVDLRSELDLFINSLTGRVINIGIKKNDESQTEIIYRGFIAEIPDEISVQRGTQIALKCQTLLSQLNQLSSTRNWDESLKAYGNIFTSLTGNTVNMKKLLVEIVDGTLLEGATFEFIDGDLSPIPNTVWASINNSRTRLQVLREILIAYNRIVYQLPNGRLIISPLFYNDYANPNYNVDAVRNDGNYIALSATNGAAKLPNRIDCIFGVNLPYEAAGDNAVDVEGNLIYSSAPYTSTDSKKMIPLPQSNGISYTDIYKTTTRLYNSGKWVNPLQKPIDIGNLYNDTILANLLLYHYKLSNVWSKPPSKYDNFARFYAQQFLAELNTTNYNASIIYDYSKFWGLSNPLCKIITINHHTKIDYPQMIVTSMSLSFDNKNGSIMAITTAPLMSITASWGNLNLTNT